MINCQRIIDIGGEFTGEYLISDIREDYTAKIRSDKSYVDMNHKQKEQTRKRLNEQHKELAA